jgi:hypothetical protein
MYVNRTVFAQSNRMTSVYCRAKQQICVLSDVMTTLYLRAPKATKKRLDIYRERLWIQDTPICLSKWVVSFPLLVSYEHERQAVM